MTAASIIELLGLQPHPEGGHYAETFRSTLVVSASWQASALSASTAIYYLLTAGEFSSFHRIRSDEIWHFYGGAPLRLHQLSPAGNHSAVELGMDLFRGERPQAVVPAGIWQAAEVAADDETSFSLVGCTVAPGFEFRDFEIARRAELAEAIPGHAQLIARLTRG